MIAWVETLIDGTAILSLTLNSFSDLRSGLRLTKYRGYDVIAATPFTATLPLVFDHSVTSDGAPVEMKCMVPDNRPSFMTLGPATFGQLVFRFSMPARACFSIVPSRSMSMSGRKLTPN